MHGGGKGYRHYDSRHGSGYHDDRGWYMSVRRPAVATAELQKIADPFLRRRHITESSASQMREAVLTLIAETSPAVLEGEMQSRVHRLAHSILRTCLKSYRSAVEQSVQRVLDNPATASMEQQLELLNLMQGINDSLSEVGRALDCCGGEVPVTGFGGSIPTVPVGPAPAPPPRLDGTALLASIRLKLQQNGAPPAVQQTEAQSSALERVERAVAAAKAAQQPTGLPHAPLLPDLSPAGGGGVPEGRALPPSLLQTLNSPALQAMAALPQALPPSTSAVLQPAAPPSKVPQRAELVAVSSLDITLRPGDCAWYRMDEDSVPSYARVVEAKCFSGNARCVLYTVRILSTKAERAVEGDMLLITKADAAALLRPPAQGAASRAEQPGGMLGVAASGAVHGVVGRSESPSPQPPEVSPSRSSRSSASSFSSSRSDGGTPSRSASEDEEVFCVPFQTEAKAAAALSDPEEAVAVVSATAAATAAAAAAAVAAAEAAAGSGGGGAIPADFVPPLPAPSAVVEGPLPPPSAAAAAAVAPAAAVPEADAAEQQQHKRRRSKDDTQQQQQQPQGEEREREAGRQRRRREASGDRSRGRRRSERGSGRDSERRHRDRDDSRDRRRRHSSEGADTKRRRRDREDSHTTRDRERRRRDRDRDDDRGRRDRDRTRTGRDRDRERDSERRERTRDRRH